jgi:hypothetical protein
MCTIMTIDRPTFEANYKEFINRILIDEASNPHGIAIMMYSFKYGLTKLESNKFQASFLGGVWDRVWVHCRYGTTDTTGIDGCHNFPSGDGWYIQHNGVVRCGNGLPVDSMAIAQLTKLLGPQDALETLKRTGESFANTFIVNEYGEYYVGRASSGTLFTDGKGNFSSKQVCDLNSPVPNDSIFEFKSIANIPDVLQDVAFKLAQKGIWHIDECSDKERNKLRSRYTDLELAQINAFLADI